MSEASTFILLGAGLLAAPLLLHLFCLIFAEYRLGRHEVEVLLFNRVIRRVALNQIDDVIVGTRFPCELWPSRDFFQGRFLSIRKKRGLFRYLVICPKHPVQLRANIYFALGWNPHGSTGN